MTNDMAIEIKGLSKVYRLYDRPVDRLKEALLPFHKRYSRDFYALRDINLSIKKGETVGFIGQNGAGKSTILKVITGVLTPTSGTVEVNGRIASLLELGAGFNPEMTGVENIYMNGVVMGLSREEMDARLDDIIAFADIGDFIHQPVKMYSSGMFARVAFAVNAFVEPDILIVDEALSVGDSFFQAKCMNRMKSMLDDGVTVLFVSHDLVAVRNLCQNAVHMEHGEIVFKGKADEVVEEYIAARIRSRQFTEETATDSVPKDQPALEKVKRFLQTNEEFQRNASYQRVQNGKVSFVNVELLDEAGNSVRTVSYGQRVKLCCTIKSETDIEILTVGYHINSKDGVEVIYSDSWLDRKPFLRLKKGRIYIFEYSFSIRLCAGDYNIGVVMSIPLSEVAGDVETCDVVPLAIQFSVAADPLYVIYGCVHWDNEFELSEYDFEKDDLAVRIAREDELDLSNLANVKFFGTRN